MGNEAILDALVEAIESRQKERGFKHTQPTGVPTTNYMHGPGGIFGVSGLERDLISTRVQPRSLAGLLQALGTIRTNPLFPYITGFQDTSGTTPDGVCDNCPTAGNMKSCIQTAQFGRYCYQTKEIELNRTGQQTNRGEFLDLRLVNDPLLRDMGGLLTMNIPGTPDLIREVLMAFLSVGVAFQNTLIQQLYAGNPVNNSGGGGYSEFPGLDILIGTNKVDALTGINCPSLDSDIKDFAYGLVCDTTPDIVHMLTYMMRYLRHNATRMGFDPVQWVIAMRPELFYEITACWPCSYLTYRCAFRSGTFERINVDAKDHVAMRDAMRQGKYLLIDGMQIGVVEDDGIVEETDADNANILAGQFASDIYVIPLSVSGGFATTFWQFLDYARGAMVSVQDGRYIDDFWTDGGRFLWHKKPPLNWCVQWIAKIEPRLILLTPHLAGRIQNVRYEPLQHTRQPFPTDPYFVDGGQTHRDGPSHYSDWSLP